MERTKMWHQYVHFAYNFLILSLIIHSPVKRGLHGFTLENSVHPLNTIVKHNWYKQLLKVIYNFKLIMRPGLHSEVHVLFVLEKAIHALKVWIRIKYMV